GELYLEYRQAESLAFDDGRLKSASFDTAQGFGLRAVAGEAAGYAHGTSLSEETLRQAGSTVRAALAGHDGVFAVPPPSTNTALYSSDNPLAAVP
ncbi:PmbA/TldA family metallopeptidase, partial [Elizabethkingia meningoseptica]|uniref:PmbA/TldA family metallopeptidase n=1 Tax=Elizabethkingia meningoseptica TaxID=238 RepID=UPI0031932584